MYTGHDDGWGLHLYYTNSKHLMPLLTRVSEHFDVQFDLEPDGLLSTDALWISHHKTKIVQRTLDIDFIQHKHYKPIT